MFREWIKQYSCKTQVILSPILLRNPSQKTTKYFYGIWHKFIIVAWLVEKVLKAVLMMYRMQFKNVPMTHNALYGERDS